jgi:hypothetical protein
VLLGRAYKAFGRGRVRAPKTPKEGNDLYPCRRRHGERALSRTCTCCPVRAFSRQWCEVSLLQALSPFLFATMRVSFRNDFGTISEPIRNLFGTYSERAAVRCAPYAARLICGFARKDMRLGHILLPPVVSASRGFAPFARSTPEEWLGGDGLSCCWGQGLSALTNVPFSPPRGGGWRGISIAFSLPGSRGRGAPSIKNLRAFKTHNVKKRAVSTLSVETALFLVAEDEGLGARCAKVLKLPGLFVPRGPIEDRVIVRVNGGGVRHYWVI